MKVSQNFIDELVQRATQQQSIYPSLRYGQCLMNALSVMDLDLYRRVTGKDGIDPFSVDANADAFFAYIQVDNLVWTLAEHYKFNVSFCDVMKRFRVQTNNKRSEDFFWTSDKSTESFLDDVREYFLAQGTGL